jgi:iron complex outermembrane receptor protein
MAPLTAARAQGKSPESAIGLEEIVVTATRRAQAVNDVPIAVTAVTGAELANIGADNIQDYYRIVPNMAVVDRGPGGRQYSIRGVSTGIVDLGASTVGVYIDEMPVSATGFQPDLSVYDLDRVEVLRGPQGTLFGEGSVGGTVRMITPTPDTGGFDANVSVDYSSTSEGGNNSAANAMVNFAFSDSVALRLTGYYRDRDGYIDRIENQDGIDFDFGAAVGAPGAFPPVLNTGPIPGAKDINSEETTGGRLSFLWNATDRLGVKLSYLTQDSEFGGRNIENAALGELESDFIIDETVDDELDLANLSISYDFGWGTLLSSTSTYERDRGLVADTNYLGLSLPIPMLLAGTATVTTELQDQVSQELRLTSSGNGRFKWTVGAFYLDKDNGYEQGLLDEFDFFVNWTNIFFRDIVGFFPSPPFPITSPDQILDQTGTFEETQYAVYGEVDYRFSDQWSGTLGARYYDYEKTDTNVNNDINILGLGLVDGTWEADDSGTNLKFGLNYEPDANLLMYATAAEGFRIGGTNTAPLIPPENVTYGPDSLWSYELGAKWTLADGRVQLNSAVYYIDWSDIQLSLPFGFSFAVANAGEARVIGAEIELAAKPSENWDLSLAIGLNDGELTEDAPRADDPANPNPGFKGDRLPGTPDMNAALSVQRNFSIASRDAFVRLDYSYTGDSTTTFNELSVRGGGESSHFELDSYSLLNLRFGIQSGHWGATLYVDNATDELADLLTDNAAVVTRTTRNRPRTVGLQLQYNY